MTNITMKAVDTLHISAVGPHTILADQEFEVPGHVADDLEARGLATRAAAAQAKQEPAAPENKAAAAPANKTAAKSK